MEFDMLPKVFEGRNAICAISGDNEWGYLTVLVDGKEAEVGPDLRPDENPKRRSFFAMRFGGAVEVFTKPGWTAAQRVKVQCFLADGTKVGESDELIVV